MSKELHTMCAERFIPALSLANFMRDTGYRLLRRAFTILGVLFAFPLICRAQVLAPPGVVVNHLAASTKTYIGSPSLVVLWTGEYLASHDIFGPGGESNTTLIFASGDRGLTWTKRAEVKGAFWSTLFVNGSSLYLIGPNKEHGDLVIRRSEDDGASWTSPRGPHQGLLLEGGKYHSAPTATLLFGGKVWKAMEDEGGEGGWGKHFRAFMISCSMNNDLLEASNWTSTNKIALTPDWLDGKFGGFLEGNAVFTLDGKILDILRVEHPSDDEYAARLEISEDGKKADFKPDTGFFHFPGGAKKFTIRYDLSTKLYWSIVNYVPKANRVGKPNPTRNTLALVSSKDLIQWDFRGILLQHPDAVSHAFQYVDWQFDSKDIIAVSRTAFDDPTGGAHNFHDANFLTFHRFTNYKKTKITPFP
ncbi:MAG: exo-alpha-sialidase [Chthonomonadales bacterium]